MTDIYIYTKSTPPPRVVVRRSNLFLPNVHGQTLRMFTRACYDYKDRNALVYIHKTSKNVKMNFFEFLPKICKKAGKFLTPWMSHIRTGRREKLCLSRVDARARLDTLCRTIKALLTVSTGSSLVLSFFRVVVVVVFVVVVQTHFSASGSVFVFFNTLQSSCARWSWRVLWLRFLRRGRFDRLNT